MSLASRSRARCPLLKWPTPRREQQSGSCRTVRVRWCHLSRLTRRQPAEMPSRACPRCELSRGRAHQLPPFRHTPSLHKRRHLHHPWARRPIRIADTLPLPGRANTSASSRTSATRMAPSRLAHLHLGPVTRLPFPRSRACRANAARQTHRFRLCRRRQMDSSGRRHTGPHIPNLRLSSRIFLLLFTSRRV